MAGGQERELRRRIRSVQSTMKITRATELIATSRILRAQQRVAAARPYSEAITEVIRNLASAGAGGDSPLVNPRDEVRSVGFVVITADRGLAEGAMREQAAAGARYRLYVCGRKGLSYFRFRDYDIAESFTGFSEQPAYEDARRVAERVVADFEAGEVDRVELAYTQFLSVSSQRPLLRRFLPVETEGAGGGRTEASEGPGADYEYEPEPGAILDRLVPRYVESRLYAAMLDAAASEQASRQRAMKSATDNASDLIKRYERSMNRVRQDSITTEIIEIASGAEALAQNRGHERPPDIGEEQISASL